MVPDPLRLALALMPLAAYCAVLGAVNARRRPFITTGGSDLAVLGGALSGVVLVGPIQLFRPLAASAEFGGYVWIFLLVFYWLWIWLAVLLSRPRLVVYNVSGEELRPLVAETARELDPQARWAGESLALPTLGVQLHLEVFEPMRNVSLVASGGRQNAEGWRALHAQLRTRLVALPTVSNPRAVGLVLAAAALTAVSIGALVGRPAQVAAAAQEMLAF